jgi:hypothetical protein
MGSGTLQVIGVPETNSHAEQSQTTISRSIDGNVPVDAPADSYSLM